MATTSYVISASTLHKVYAGGTQARYIDQTNFMTSRNSTPCPRSATPHLVVPKLASPKTHRNTPTLKDPVPQRKYATSCTDLRFQQINRKSCSIDDGFSKATKPVLNSLSPKDIAMGRFMQKTYKFHTTFLDKNAMSVKRVSLCQTPGLKIAKSKFADFLNDVNTRPKSRLMPGRRASLPEENARITDSIRSQITAVLNKHNPNFMTSLDRPLKKEPVGYFPRMTPTPALENVFNEKASKIRQERIKCIYEKILRKAEGKKSAKELLAEHFNKKDIDTNGLENKVKADTMKVELVSYGKKANQRKLEENKIVHKTVTPVRKLQRAKSYGRWYMPPNKFAVKLLH